jgi:oligopeptidase B
MDRLANKARRRFLAERQQWHYYRPVLARAAQKAMATKPRWPQVTPPCPPHFACNRATWPPARRSLQLDEVRAGWGERTRTNLPKAVATMLTGENAYADAVLKPLDGMRAELLEAMLARSTVDVAAPPVERDGWIYSSRIAAATVHAVYSRSRVGSTPEILVDEAERAAGQPYFRSTGHQPSLDHRWYVWAEDVIGNDRHRIVIRDNRDGTIRTLVDKDAYGYGGPVFAPSSEWVFWIWRDAHNRPTRLYRTSVDGRTTELVYEEKRPRDLHGGAPDSGRQLHCADLVGADTAEVRLIRAGSEGDAPAVVWPRRPGVRYEIDEWAGSLIAATDADDAFDMKLLRLIRKASRSATSSFRTGQGYRSSPCIPSPMPWCDWNALTGSTVWRSCDRTEVSSGSPSRIRPTPSRYRPTKAMPRGMS